MLVLAHLYKKGYVPFYRAWPEFSDYVPVFKFKFPYNFFVSVVFYINDGIFEGVFFLT